MIPMSLGEIAGIVGGELHDGDAGAVVDGSVEYDSRKVGPGGLFVASAGAKVDDVVEYVRTLERALVVDAVNGAAWPASPGRAAAARRGRPGHSGCGTPGRRAAGRASDGA